MTYRWSFPVSRWLNNRREAIGVLASAHADAGEVDGPGRPLEIGRPLAHAYILRVVAEFQGFVRDLHDLAVEKVVTMSQPDGRYRAMLIAAATEDRFIDRGNADLGSLRRDFRRLGIGGLSDEVGLRNGHWKRTVRRRGDKAYYQDLIELRNALAHGNQSQLDRLRSRGVVDTLTWARDRLPGLDRFAGALDRLMWDHLRETFEVEPW